MWAAFGLLMLIKRLDLDEFCHRSHDRGIKLGELIHLVSKYLD